MLTGTPPANRWVVVERNPGASLQLVCFPYAGGTAALFKHWQRYLPPQVELVAVQLPGRAERSIEPPMTEWQDLIPVLSQAVATTLDRPFVFFGHSLGALLSFEVARWLRRHHGLCPERLFVSGRRAPQCPSSEPPTWNLAEDQFVRRLRDVKGTPAEILENTELLRVLLPRLRADFRLVETYGHVAEARLRCPITAFGGTDDDEAQEGRLSEWRAQTSSTFTTHVLAGDHFFMHSRERELLALIRSDLSRMVTPASA